MIQRRIIGDNSINKYEVLFFVDKELPKLLKRKDFRGCKIQLLAKIFVDNNVYEDYFYFFIDNDKTSQDYKDFKNHILARVRMYEKCYMEIEYILGGH